MGDWNITISGTGQHHNGSENDAEVIADQLVRRLMEAGQEVRHAEFVSGGKLVFPTNDHKL